MAKVTEADEHIEGMMMKPAGAIGKAAKSEKGRMIGGWAFMVGLLISVIAGLLVGLEAIGVSLGITVQTTGLLMGIMALIGLIVGVVNVSDKEAISFLIGAIAIVVASGSMSALANLGYGVFPAIALFIGNLMNMVSYFVAPAAIIVALKVIYASARKA